MEKRTQSWPPAFFTLGSIRSEMRSGSWLHMACRCAPSVLSPKYEVFCCDQNGPSARREEGAYLNRYVTDEQRSRRPIFIATLRAGAGWRFFCVAHSTRMSQIGALVRALKNSQLTSGKMHAISGTGH